MRATHRRAGVRASAAICALLLGSVGVMAAPGAGADDGDAAPEPVTTSIDRPATPKRGFIRVDVALWRTGGGPYTVTASYDCRRGTCRETLRSGQISGTPRIMRLRNVRPARGDANITLTFVADSTDWAVADIYPKIGDCDVQQTPGGRTRTRISCEVSTRGRIVITDDLCSRPRGPVARISRMVC